MEKIFISDSAKYFNPKSIKKDLLKISTRGVMMTFYGQAIKFVLQTGSTMVLARLLTPGDFGLVAMVSAFTGFIKLFKDLGLSMATLQRAEINHSHVSSLFWVNVGLSTLLLVVGLVMAPLVAWFYEEQKLTFICIFVSFTFIFGGLSAQHTALIRRQMRFSILASIEVISQAVGIICAIILALFGAKYWSLVAQIFFSAITNTILVWVFSKWRPGKFTWSEETKASIRFGGHLTGHNVVNYFTRNMDNILIGAAWGAGALGIYSKAYNLFMLPLNQVDHPIAAVAIPALSRLQNEPERYRNYYLHAIQLISYITMPMVVLMALLSREIIYILLGDQWADAVPIFRILAIYGIFQSIRVTTGWILITTGQTQRMFKLGIINSLIMVGSFAVGLPWGPFGVAVSATICAGISFLPMMAMSYKNSPINLRDIAAYAWKPMVISILILFVGGTAIYFGGSLSPMIKTIIVISSGIIVFSFAIFLWKGVWEDVSMITRLIKKGT